MNDTVSMIEELSTGFQDLASQVIVYLPRVVAAVLVLVIGWLLARALSLLLVRAISQLDELWHRLISKRGLAPVQTRRPPTRVVGELVFWLLMFVFVILAGEVLGLDIFGAWLKEVFAYLLYAAAGLFIVLVGYVVSSLARDMIVSAAESADMLHGDLLARTAQIIILFIAIILGIDQIGIDVLFLSVIAGIILSSMLGGIALAFGLGARTHVSNIIAANQLRQIYNTGDKIRIGEIEGRVLDIMTSRVIVETESGNVDVPAKLFDEEIVTIIEKGG
jgi:small-conductance mechanosensitive channel